MAAEDGGFRSRRTPSSGAAPSRRGRARRTVVAVTGAASPLGAAVVSAVHEAGYDVVAVDSTLPDPLEARSGVAWRKVEVAGPEVADGLAGADVVVHLAAPTDLEAALAQDPVARRARAVRSAQAVVTAAAAVGARRLVAVTSAMVLGASPDNPVPLPDDAPLLAPLDSGLVGDLLDVERVLERAPTSHPSLAVAVLRPAALVGPGVDTVVTRHFEAPRLLAVRGSAMRWQFCHVQDAATAVVAAVQHGLSGPLTCGSEPLLDSPEVEALSGMRRVELPAGLAFATAERLHRVGVLPMPAGDLAYVVHPWAVGSTRLREVGWQPRRSTAECLAALLEAVQGRRALVGRRVERRDAALGAAGAAVALVGTAAAVRQARARRSRRSRPQA